MPELFIYLLKVNIALVLFYLVFHFLLRRLTFYTLNRFYLLFAFLFSALFPFFDLKDWAVSKERAVPEGVQYMMLDWDSMQKTGFDVWPYLEICFWAVVIFFVLRMLFRLLSLWQIHRESIPATWQFFSYRHVLRRIDPFSFWKNIYVHVEAHQDGELYDIFSHEQIHVEQLHTLDTLMSELFTVVCWFNPVSWLLRTAVRENLEFITDRRVIQSGVDRQAYQYSLLKIGGMSTGDNLGNHFNFKHLKTRIMMMNKRRSSHAHLGKYIFALPVVMVLALVFTLTKAYEAEPDQLPEEMWVSGDVISSGALTDKSLPQNTVIIGRRMQAVLNHQDSALKNSDRIKISGDSLIIRGEKKFVLGTVKGSPMFVLDGVPVANGKLGEIHSDDIESVAVLKGASAVSSYGSTAREGVILIKTKQGLKVNNVTSATAVRSGSEVAGRIIQADSVQVTRIKIEGRNLDEDPRLREMVVKGFPAAVQDSVIVRGVRRIEGSRLFKTGDSVSFNFRQGSRMTVSILDSMNFQSAPPYVLIDGKEGDLSTVSPEKIESITVLKGDNDSAKRYGSRAAHGVVLVMTKK